MPISRDVEDLYAAQYPVLAAFAFRLTGSREAGHDIAQEAFTRLLARRLGVRRPVPFLFQTVANLATDGWRRAQRDQRLGAALRTVSDDTVAMPDAATRDAVRRLPKAEREVVFLFYFADLPVAEVAAVLDRPAGTVKWLLASARERLALSLGDPDA